MSCIAGNTLRYINFPLCNEIVFSTYSTFFRMPVVKSW